MAVAVAAAEAVRYETEMLADPYHAILPSSCLTASPSPRFFFHSLVLRPPSPFPPAFLRRCVRACVLLYCVTVVWYASATANTTGRRPTVPQTTGDDTRSGASARLRNTSSRVPLY